ncbi:MAG TPA: ferredoxin [Propionibacterium sp.]|nr:ferredoxin [Propionibacterium sp.]
MKFVYDSDKCEGHGQCEMLSPEHFQLEDDGRAKPLKSAIDSQDQDLAREVVMRCPAAAISIAKAVE